MSDHDLASCRLRDPGSQVGRLHQAPDGYGHLPTGGKLNDPGLTDVDTGSATQGSM